MAQLETNQYPPQIMIEHLNLPPRHAHDHPARA
jgi:hypothetical protein